MKTTNYFNTFIQVADDCPARSAEVPPRKPEGPTVAQLQFDLLYDNPYTFSSDEVLFQVHAQRQAVPITEQEAARTAYFSTGQPCFRASPLTKRYGWGIHCNGTGKMALYAVDSQDYQRLAADDTLQQVKAMRSKKA